jgi:DNA-binding XRE family transcriptional regulator
MSQKKGKTLIAERREELGFTQAQMARRAQVDTRTLQSWEYKGHPGPMPVWKVPIVCRAYEWTVDQLVAACYPDKANVLSLAAEKPGDYIVNGGTA